MSIPPPQETASVSTGSTFIGREVEKGFFSGALEQVSRGKGCLLLFSGEPGIGKSRLADELASDAARHGFVVAWGRCWEAGGAPAYWPIVQALRSCVSQFSLEAVQEAAGQRASEIAPILPELSEMLGDLPEPSSLDPEAARFRLFDATTTFLSRLSRAQPIFLVFDDLHVADTPSLLFLRFLADGIDSARVLIVAAYRDPDPDRDKPLDPALIDLNRSSVTRPFKLGGLSRSDVSQFVEVNAGQPAPEALISLLHEETEGNPLFLGEVVRLLASEGRIGAAQPASGFRLTIPESVRVAISRRIDRLTPETQRLLSSASVLGREFGVDVLERLVGEPRSELLPLLDEAAEFRLLNLLAETPGSMRFSHALIRDVLYDGLPPGARLNAHLRAGAALEECYATNPEPHLAELAYHFVEAAQVGHSGKAIDYARRAGERAAALLAHEEAARLYGLALNVLDATGDASESERCELLLSLGDAQARSGEYWTAKTTFSTAADLARRVGTPEQLARAAIGYGGRYVWGRASGDRRIIPLLEDALAALDPADTSLRARVMARLAGALRDFPEGNGMELAAEAVAIARASDEATLAFCLGSFHSSQWGPDSVQQRIRIADELVSLASKIGDKEREFEGHGYKFYATIETGDIEGTRRELAAQERVLDELKQPSQKWWVLILQVALAVLEGRLRHADDLSVQAWELGHRVQTSDGEPAFVWQHVEIRRQQGRAVEAEEILARAAREFTWYPGFRCLLARYHCEAGRRAEGTALFEELVTPEGVNLPIDNQWLFNMSALAEVCYQLEDSDRAASLYELLLPYPERVPALPELIGGSMALSLALLSATLGRSEDADFFFVEAMRVNEAIGARLWLVQTQYYYARVLLDRGGRPAIEAGRALIKKALGAARELELVALEDRLLELSSLVADEGGAAVTREHDLTSIFRCEGEYWSIGHHGKTMRLKDSKGIEYIARLLASPGEEIHALDLLAGSSVPAGKPARADLAEHGIGKADGSGSDVLDSQARLAYRSRLEELREELAEADEWNDPERASRVREEMDFITRELTQALGLGGRSRQETSDAERARQSVTKAIKQALGRIAKHDPELAGILGRSVQTGLFCRYEPALAGNIAWRL